MNLPGAAWNERKSACELSLTLETLRAIRKKLVIMPNVMARMVSPEVMAWARAADSAEKFVNELHGKLATGWRQSFPWTDSTGAVRPPFEHQRIMASAAAELDAVAFLAEMGTGKTRAAIEAMRFKFDNGLIDVALVAAPRGALNVWEREVKMWAPNLTIIRLSGVSIPKRIAIVEHHIAQGTPRVVFLTNYEVIWKMRECLDRVAHLKRFAIIADEMHKLANPEAQVTKAFMGLARFCAWRVGLTGTPIPNKLGGVWSQWYFIDLGQTFGANNVQFRREFFDVNPYSWEVKPKNDNVYNEIGLRMRRRGLRFTKAECLDLPPKIYETVEVEMTTKQRRAYKEMERTLIAELSAGVYVTAAIQLVAILRLTQITSGFAPDSESGKIHHFEGNPKLDALEDIVRQNIDAQQIIVWARYTEDIRAIMERLADLGPVPITGGQNDAKRLGAEDAFQSATARLLVGNPAAGGVALNLQQGSLAIYYSQSHSFVDRAQSEDRCHRSGSQIHEKVTYIDLMCANTADLIVREAVMEKKNVHEIVVDLKHALGLTA